MEMDEDPILMSHPPPYHYNQSDISTFDEKLAAAIGEDFPNPICFQNNTSSPQPNLDYDIIGPFASPLHKLVDEDNNHNNSNGDAVDNLIISFDAQQYQQFEAMQGNTNEGQNDIEESKKESSEQVVNTKGAKRKRPPSQVQDHVIAERKRREVISQRFIALSAIVPGLKKIDKTSVLEEAIKYMKQLQEKVKVLKEEASATKGTMQSVIMVKKSQVLIEDDSVGYNGLSSAACMVNGSSTGSGDSGGGSGDFYDSLPEIEVKLSDKSLLLKVYCQKDKRILTRLFKEVEKHDINVVNCGIISFGSMALDITIVAQMERGFNKNVKDLVKGIRSALLLARH